MLHIVLEINLIFLLIFRFIRSLYKNNLSHMKYYLVIDFLADFIL